MQSTSVSTDGNETFKPVNDSVNYHLHGADFIRATGCRQSVFLFTIRHGKNFLFLSLYSFPQKVCFIRHRKQRLRLIRWQTDGSMPTWPAEGFLSEKGKTLSFVYTTPEYMDKENSDRLTSSLNMKQLEYEWETESFSRRNNLCVLRGSGCICFVTSINCFSVYVF